MQADFTVASLIDKDNRWKEEEIMQHFRIEHVEMILKIPLLRASKVIKSYGITINGKLLSEEWLSSKDFYVESIKELTTYSCKFMEEKSSSRSAVPQM